MEEPILPQAILTPDQRVRLFISSTLKELKQEREAVRTAIRQLKLHPIMFEAGARPHGPRDLYRAYLEQSHVYIGIFFESYGEAAAGMTISGIEDEYNLSEGRPRLIYVKNTAGARHPRLEELLERIRREGAVSYKPFSTAEELGEFVKDDVMSLLSERFGLSAQFPRKTRSPVDYLSMIKTDMEGRGVIKRMKVISEIKAKLQNEPSLLVVGDPGIGKTFLLGTLGEELNAVYISLRNKTPQQVLSHLANRLSLRRNQFPKNLLSEDEARSALQDELANNSALLLIDDVDQNINVVESLSGLDLYSCQLVFAARSDRALAPEISSKYHVRAFDAEETERFLALHHIILPPGEFQSLRSASQGNPLYLYYFSQHQISPPPSGLEEYQRILWERVASEIQQIMNFISFSLTPLRLEDLHALLNADYVVTSTIMESKRLLDSATPLVRRIDGFYEIFHPHFEDYICEEALEAALSGHYHSALADYALKQRMAGANSIPSVAGG